MELVTLDLDNLDPESLNGVVVRKHNDLIEARYRLPNLREQQVIYALLGKIKPDDEDFKGYQISVSDFAKFIGVTSKSIYEDMEQTLTNLAERTVKIKQGKSFLVASWLSSAKYVHGSGYVELRFDPNLKPYLLQLKDHFTQYKLEAVLHFKSVYAIRLYEMLKKEAFKARLDPETKTKRFEIEYSYEEMREFFGINKKEYKLFADFKRKTIEPAVTEIYDKTDLNIYDVVYGKTGRAVSRILFKIELRSKADADIRAVQIRLEEQPKKKEPSGKEEIHRSIQALIDNGFSFENAKTYKTKYGVKQIERNIAYVQGEIQSGTKINNLPAYLSRAIQEDWGKATDDKKALIEAKKKEEELEKARKEKDDEEKASIQKALKKKIIGAFFTLPEGVKNHIKTEYRAVLEGKKKMQDILIWDNTIDSQERLLVSHIAWDFANFLIEKNYVN